MALIVGTSGADFRSRMKLRSEKVKKQVERKIIRYGSTLQQQLVLSTPILTGQAKANWQASIGAPGGSFVGKGGPTSNRQDLAHGPPAVVDYGSYEAQAQGVIAGFKVGQVLYIFSNLPYIESLNAGSSTQAPAGFVETAVMKASAAAKGA